MEPFDLDSFAPAPCRFTIAGVNYWISSDPDVDTVARMLRIEDEIRDSDEARSTVGCVTEGRDLIHGMIREAMGPDVPMPKIGAQLLVVLFALIMHGASVATAVGEAISRPADAIPQDETDDERAAREEREAVELAKLEEAGPLGSASSSPGPSSGSDAHTAGAPATGTA